MVLAKISVYCIIKARLFFEKTSKINTYVILIKILLLSRIIYAINLIIASRKIIKISKLLDKHQESFSNTAPFEYLLLLLNGVEFSKVQLINRK